MEHAGSSLLRDGVILLGFALAFVLLFRRLGLGATLGYLVAGALVGPHLLGLVGDAEDKMGIAELGITLLLFIVGLGHRLINRIQILAEASLTRAR